MTIYINCPNSQEIQRFTNKTMDGGPATIHDLQQELLEKIFKMLEEPDLVSVQNVCYRWSDIVDRRVGRNVYVSIERLHWTDSSKVRIDQLSQIGIRSCFIVKRPEGIEDLDDDDVEDPEENQDDWESPLVGELKHPWLLRELELHGSLPPDVFARLVRNARNLSHFEISLFTLAKLRNEDLSSLILPNLRELNVDMLGLDEWEDKYWDTDDNDFLPNLKTLLTESHFPRLTLLELDLPPASFSDLSTIRILITFVQNNYSLHILRVSMGILGDTVNNVIPEHEDPATHHELRSIIDGIRKRGERHLRELRIEARTEEAYRTHGLPFLGPMEIINEFLLHVTSLEYLSLTLGPIPSSTLQAICKRNSRTLRELYISNDYSTVDCSMFASLQDAQVLLVFSCDGIVGITQLPPSLRKIFVSGPIEQTDASHILFHLPNIREISLEGRNLLNRNDPGDHSCVTLDMLIRFVENRRVESLFIIEDCLVKPETFPPEGITNNDPNNPIMLQFRSPDFDELSWRLNEDGFYIFDYE